MACLFCPYKDGSQVSSKPCRHCPITVFGVTVNGYHNVPSFRAFFMLYHRVGGRGIRSMNALSSAPKPFLPRFSGLSGVFRPENARIMPPSRVIAGQFRLRRTSGGASLSPPDLAFLPGISHAAVAAFYRSHSWMQAAGASAGSRQTTSNCVRCGGFTAEASACPPKARRPEAGSTAAAAARLASSNLDHRVRARSQGKASKRVLLGYRERCVFDRVSGTSNARAGSLEEPTKPTAKRQSNILPESRSCGFIKTEPTSSSRQ